MKYNSTKLQNSWAKQRACAPSINTLAHFICLDNKCQKRKSYIFKFNFCVTLNYFDTLIHWIWKLPLGCSVYRFQFNLTWAGGGYTINVSNWKQANKKTKQNYVIQKCNSYIKFAQFFEMFAFDQKISLHHNKQKTSLTPV